MFRSCFPLPFTLNHFSIENDDSFLTLLLEKLAMRTTNSLFGFATLGTFLIACSASAGIIATYAEIGSEEGGLADSVVYGSIPGPYAAFPDGVNLGVANYSSIMALDAEVVTLLRFVGGVTVANTTLQFNFADAAGTAVSSFEITLAQAGNFIWTLTLDATDEILASKNGSLSITGVAAATGKWFLTTTAASVGSQAPVSGAYIYAFELTTNGVPAPGAIALLGLAGLVGRRRR